MFAYILRRLGFAVIVVFGVLTLVFFSLRLAPGDPIDMLIPPGSSGQASKALAAQLRAKYGLDQPLYTQYFKYIGRVLHLDLGDSIRTGRSVLQELLRRYPATIELTIASLLVAAIAGIGTGVLAAIYRDSWVDNFSVTFALLGISLPNYLIGPLLMLVFALYLGWLPPAGRIGGLSLEGLRYLILPAATLAVAEVAIVTRLVRASMLDVLREDYVRTARAKGLREFRVIVRHALKNAFIPVITVLGLEFGTLLSGAIITETIFAWPGVGRYLINGINSKDFPMVQGAVICIAVTFVLVNLLVDFLYAFLDPRLKY